MRLPTPTSPLERSPFWAVTLVGGLAVAGVLLLIGLRLSGPAWLWIIAPCVLITAVLERMAWVRVNEARAALLGLGNVLSVALSLFLASGPAPTGGPVSLVRETRSFERGGLGSARVALETVRSDLDVRAGARETLLWVRGQHYGSKATLKASGEQVTLREPQGESFCLECLRVQRGEREFWNVRLARDLPLELSTTTASGDANLELASLEVSKLSWTTTGGALRASLPARLERLNTLSLSGEQNLSVQDKAEVQASVQSTSGDLTLELGQKGRASLRVYTETGRVLLRAGREMRLSGGVRTRTGRLEVVLAEGASGLLTLRSAAGDLLIDLASAQAVRLSGVPARVDRLRGLKRVALGPGGGVWQSVGYSTAERRLELSLKLDSGALELR